jgi:hypothetical protein
MTERCEPGLKPGYPDGGRTHVNAATRLTQIEGHTEYTDLTWGKGLYPTV